MIEERSLFVRNVGFINELVFCGMEYLAEQLETFNH